MKNHSSTELVYFILDRDSNRVKVGLSSRKNLKRRLSAIQTANAGKLILLKVVRGGRKIERALHKTLERWRLGGEWFSYEPIAFFIDTFAPLPEEQMSFLFPGQTKPSNDVEAPAAPEPAKAKDRNGNGEGSAAA